MTTAAGPHLSDATFEGFRRLLFSSAGIDLAESKKPLVSGRLLKRLRALGLDGFDDYLKVALRDASEAQQAVDLLTTNETHFFREPAHFAALRDLMIPSLPKDRPPRLWSAASSTGQEAYSIAMVLKRYLAGRNWEVFGSDISSRVIEVATKGLYPMSQAHEIPVDYLREFCLKGTGSQEGTFAIQRELREKVTFANVNLSAPLPTIGRFDVIFLRNVLIYFSGDTRKALVRRVVECLQPGGWFVVGHSESISDLELPLRTVQPSVYRKA